MNTVLDRDHPGYLQRLLDSASNVDTGNCGNPLKAVICFKTGCQVINVLNREDLATEREINYNK